MQEKKANQAMEIIFHAENRLEIELRVAKSATERSKTVFHSSWWHFCASKSFEIKNFFQFHKMIFFSFPKWSIFLCDSFFSSSKKMIRVATMNSEWWGREQTNSETVWIGKKFCYNCFSLSPNTDMTLMIFQSCFSTTSSFAGKNGNAAMQFLHWLPRRRSVVCVYSW